jgi:hypothetical protein
MFKFIRTSTCTNKIIEFYYNNNNNNNNNNNARNNLNNRDPIFMKFFPRKYHTACLSTTDITHLG